MKALILGFLSFFFVVFNLSAQTKIEVLNDVLFYDGYQTIEQIDTVLAKTQEVIATLPEGVFRKKTSLITSKLTSEQISSFGENNTMYVLVKASCDNYDRIGNVNLAFVPKNQPDYNPSEVTRIEIGRFVTPFMNKNKEPNMVPYRFEVNHLSQIFRDKATIEQFDLWIELEIFGVPYAAQKQVEGCADRLETFYGTVYFETSGAIAEQNTNVFIPLLFKHTLNNYKDDAADKVGETVKSVTFNVPEKSYNTRLILVTSNHGANRNGEEYNRRGHFVHFDNELVLQYTPGRLSCEPFRERNTQSNGIYGREPRSDERWQAFSNWCPGDVIDNRIIELGVVEAGPHTFKISVPDAAFVEKQGYIPVSLFLIGSKLN